MSEVSSQVQHVDRGVGGEGGPGEAEAVEEAEAYGGEGGGPSEEAWLLFSNGSIDAPVSVLSGGNAQKVILAREFEKARKLLLCNQPTRGLDVGAIEFVHRELLRKRDEGCGVLLASEELDDLFALCGRIGVMFRGRMLAILDTDKTSHEEIGRLMAGQEKAAAA